MTTFLVSSLFVIGFVTDFVSGHPECPSHVRDRKDAHLSVHERTCYMFVNNEVYWKSARDACWGLGGEMLAVKDEATMQFVRDTLQEVSWGREGVWLGARYYSGVWRWTDGDELDYKNWARGEPSTVFGPLSLEDCALMRAKDNWQWHDYLCGSLRYHYNYVCQFEVVDPPSSSPTTTALPSPSSVDAFRGLVKHSLVAARAEEDAPVEARLERLRAEIRRLFRKEGLDVSYNFLQSALSQPGDATGRIAPSATDQDEDNGYNMIMALIIGLTGGFVLLMLGTFLITYRHQRAKRKKLESAVHYTNSAYENATAGNAERGAGVRSLENTPLPPIPSSRPPTGGAKDDVYLTPLDIPEPCSQLSESHLHNLQFRPKPCHCSRTTGADHSSTPSLDTPSSFSGACGGSDPDLELRTPLVQSKVNGGQGVKANGTCHCDDGGAAAASSMRAGEGYVDMRSLSSLSPKGDGEPEKREDETKVDEDKHTYTNVDHKNVAAENHYEVLP